MARDVAALLGGANERGSVLQPETLAAMFAPQYQPDPRLPGVGFAFYRRDDGAIPSSRIGMGVIVLREAWRARKLRAIRMR